MSTLDGKQIIVTGAAQGNGEGLARGLAEAGADVILTDRQVDVGAEVAASISGSAEFHALNVLDEEAIIRLFEEVGPVDGLVNNAGVINKRTLVDLTAADLDHVLGVNLRGYIFCTREAAKQMIASGRGGSIVNIVSLGAHRGRPGFAHYAASKGGILAMTRALAVELAPHGIRVNSVSPGVMATPMNAEVLADPQLMKLSTAGMPLGRMGEPRDLVGIVELLLSERSSWMTGTDVIIDGGERASGPTFPPSFLERRDG
jgi:NAD(P)-dependent dehydrogenase (short-subunit alcohol dehydrogenase family)